MMMMPFDDEVNAESGYFEPILDSYLSDMLWLGNKGKRKEKKKRLKLSIYYSVVTINNHTKDSLHLFPCFGSIGQLAMQIFVISHYMHYVLCYYI